MMSWPAKPLSLLASAVLATGLLAGCDKGNDQRVDLPNAAAIGTAYADLPLTVSTVRLPSIYTLKAQHFLAGRLNDALTGTTEARAVLNLRAGAADSLPGNFTSASEPDSVIIQTGFDAIYGSNAQPAQLDAYLLGSPPLDERTVYNSASAQALGDAIGTNYLVPLTNTTKVKRAVSGSTDSVTVDVLDRRVRLVVQRLQARTNPAYPAVQSTYATTLFQKLLMASTVATTDQQKQLDNIIPGLVLAPSSGYNAAVLSFSRTFQGAIIVYFHPSSSSKRRSYIMRFGPTIGGAGAGTANDPRYYTQLSTDFQGNPSLASLQGASGAVRVPLSTTNGTTYVQEGTGLAAAVQFDSPEFTTLLSQPGIAINRAELLLPVQPYSNALLSNPTSLYALEVNQNNAPLQRVDGLTSVDRMAQADGYTQAARGNEALGVLVNTSSTRQYYDMLLTSYLQAYLTDPTANTLGGRPNALILTPAINTNTNLTLNRAALDGNNMRLRVYYSQLRQ